MLLDKQVFDVSTSSLGDIMLYFCDINIETSYFSENRLSELATMGIGNKPCLDIKPSADNIQDRFINIAVGNRGGMVSLVVLNVYMCCRNPTIYNL